MHDVRPIDCERTRQQISEALDSELSQLEQALVRHHVGRCAACRSFEARVTLATRALREAPVERLRTTVTLPARKPAAWAPSRVARLGSVAAVMVAAVSLALVSAPDRSTSGEEHALVGAALAEDADGVNDLLAEIRRPTAISPAPQGLSLGTGGIGASKPVLLPVL